MALGPRRQGCSELKAGVLSAETFGYIQAGGAMEDAEVALPAQAPMDELLVPTWLAVLPQEATTEDVEPKREATTEDVEPSWRP